MPTNSKNMVKLSHAHSVLRDYLAKVQPQEADEKAINYNSRINRMTDGFLNDVLISKNGCSLIADFRNIDDLWEILYPDGEVLCISSSKSEIDLANLLLTAKERFDPNSIQGRIPDELAEKYISASIHLINKDVELSKDIAVVITPDLPESALTGQQEPRGKIRNLLLNSLKLHGIDTELVLPEISDDDLKSLLKLIAPPETPDLAHLAGKNENNRKRKIKATNYMLVLIRSDCKCNHSRLANFTFKTNEWNETPNKPLSTSQLKELSILIVPPERRYRQNQHIKNSPYDPAACKCQKPEHKSALRSAK